MHIDNEDLNIFLETAIPKLKSLEKIEEKCPHCGRYIVFPLIVRQSDIDAFERLLETAKKYLSKNGVYDKILVELMDRIDKRMNIQ